MILLRLLIGLPLLALLIGVFWAIGHRLEPSDPFESKIGLGGLTIFVLAVLLSAIGLAAWGMSYLFWH